VVVIISVKSVPDTAKVVGSNSAQGVLDTTLCDFMGLWFSLGTLVSSTNKTDRHSITEIVLKVALSPYQKEA